MATWDQFARAVLAGLGVPVTADNEAAMLTWFNAEQPPNSPNGAFNPLNIQNDDFAGRGYSKTSHGQWNFPDFSTGVNAVLRELNSRLYAPIKNALASGSNPGGVLAAVQSSPWAAGHYGGHLVGELGTVEGNLGRYEAGVVAGGPATGVIPDASGGLSGSTGAQPVGLSLSDLAPWNWIPNALGGVASSVGQDVARIAIQGLFIAGGVGLVALGVYRAVAPAVHETTQEAAPAAGQAAAALGKNPEALAALA